MRTNELCASRSGRWATTRGSGTHGEAGQGRMAGLFLMNLDVSDDFPHLVLYRMQKLVILDGLSLGDQFDAAVGEVAHEARDLESPCQPSACRSKPDTLNRARVINSPSFVRHRRFRSDRKLRCGQPSREDKANLPVASPLGYPSYRLAMSSGKGWPRKLAGPGTILRRRRKKTGERRS
jgi:hypothetical protein